MHSIVFVFLYITYFNHIPSHYPFLSSFPRGPLPVPSVCGPLCFRRITYRHMGTLAVAPPLKEMSPLRELSTCLLDLRREGGTTCIHPSLLFSQTR